MIALDANLLVYVDALWSADRDFSRFAGVTVHNPLLPQAPR